MKTLFNAVLCLECGHRMEADLLTTKCERCGGTWIEAGYDCASLPADWPGLLKERPTSQWRYRELLPFPDDFRIISMGEGWTPFTRAEGLEREFGHSEIWIKDERQQPTSSFKDRQASFTITNLKMQGIDELVMASTGNAAAAYAAFCARAGIKLWVFLTSSVPAEKMRELALYGAEVVKITGTYDQAKEIAADFAARRNIYYDKGAKAIPGKESMKTVAFEIAEQMGWKAPDWYIQAVSGGIGPLGVIKGFRELLEAGMIDRMPKMAIVQSEGCAPMAQAWEKGLEKAEPVQPDTLVTVLATGNPGHAYTMLKDALDSYGGTMLGVSDGDTFRAMRMVARTEGFSTEPAASVAFAGLEKLLAEEYIKPGEFVVVNCSGHTFSAEKHVLEDRYVLNLEMEMESSIDAPRSPEGMVTALEQLDEQITKIVIIDDNPQDSRLIRRLLQSYKNYRIFEAHNGPSGLDLVRQRRPDLVMLDLTLPDMDGFTILEELKADERTSDIPVVIISAKSLTSTEWRHLRRHTESIWQKGNFSARDLVSHVVGMLNDEVIQPLALPTSTPETRAVDDRPVEDFGQMMRPNILVVDDNVWDARLMRRLFEARQRFEVLEVHSGEEAIAAIKQTVPDLIILDLVLPDVDGVKFLEMLREREETRDVPVIIISAKDIDTTTRSHLALMADSVWSKSMLDRSIFLAHVETILSE